MEYIRVRWMHNDSTYPVDMYSEVDDSRWEKRKVDFYRDGAVAFADGETEVGPTFLSEVPLPTIAEMNRDREVEATAITAEEFERIWAARHTHPVADAEGEERNRGA